MFPLEAIDEDVEIGLVLSAQGENLPLDEAFRRIRMSIRGEQAACDTEKEEPGEEMTIWVDKIYYTQKSCSPRFRKTEIGARSAKDSMEKNSRGNNIQATHTHHSTRTTRTPKSHSSYQNRES